MASSHWVLFEHQVENQMLQMLLDQTTSRLTVQHPHQPPQTGEIEIEAIS
ncbi:MAG: hypothetical protein NW224_12405 [Leptolyngbyaceae cyanobacterium bins.302]|nr:hypothetical protein [Leptolyngbyaceae cyanobacterium bins.302]